jgi:hypothetical protein
MLRITVQDALTSYLRLEGSLAGTWVADLEEAWRASNSKLAGRVIRVDLTGADRVYQLISSASATRIVVGVAF